MRAGSHEKKLKMVGSTEGGLSEGGVYTSRLQKIFFNYKPSIMYLKDQQHHFLLL